MGRKSREKKERHIKDRAIPLKVYRFFKEKSHAEALCNGDVWLREGANKQVISSQADSLIKISRIWADFFPANTSNQPI